MLLIHFDYWTWQESNHVMKLTPQQKALCWQKQVRISQQLSCRKKKLCPEVFLPRNEALGLCHWLQREEEQFSLANCTRCSWMTLSPPVQQFFPPRVSISSVKTASDVSSVNCASRQDDRANGVCTRFIYHENRTTDSCLLCVEPDDVILQHGGTAALISKRR